MNPDRPPWEEVVVTSHATKHYWRQVKAFRLVGGVLVKKRILKDGKVGFQQTVVPKALRADLLWEAHGGVVSGNL